jgi:protein tyrosine/serine phosphatase
MAVTRLTRESVVPNFRQAFGLRNVYRSAAPDNLADVLNDSIQLTDSERFILYDATLVIDLRSPTEGDEEKRHALMNAAPGGVFEEVLELQVMMSSQSKRQLFRLFDVVLTKSDYIAYVTKHWITSQQLEETGEDNRSELVYRVINAHGLMGLVEVILEAKVFICTVLKAMTVHLEQRRDGKVLIHCNSGKDRAGTLSMLCQSMLGVADEDIVKDFAKSSCIRSLAEKRYEEIFNGKVNVDSFSHASPQTMRLALHYLRNKYGSVANYLDSVGFDAAWQNRFVTVGS